MFSAAKLDEMRKGGRFELEDNQNLKDGREAFLRQMGLAGRKDLKLVGLRKFFSGPSGRQEVGFIAAVRSDGTGVAMSVHAVGQTSGVPTAYAGLLAPLDLVASKEIAGGYMKALASVPRQPFEGEFDGYRIKALQTGEGAEMLTLLVVTPLVAPELGDEIPEPPPKPTESPCMQRCRARCMATVQKCVANYGRDVCADAANAVKTECLPLCSDSCVN